MFYETAEEKAQEEKVQLECDHAIQRLQMSDRGLATLQLLRQGVDEAGLMSLDHFNQVAVIDLLMHLFGPNCGTALDALREVTTRSES
ncbi:hypothetical protein [Rubinisphaera italica]|uniref:Uncharacterized protein n=1 Tax=Rubinisphaera italica TaxID=2527969 RepID=A0A5C5XJL4_9PLAN|nr:hypothetical protein [Rubinisphaera italica]TWT63160.1 hypothetical protein Pan54_39130 [Rubinisphaera italica]